VATKVAAVTALWRLFVAGSPELASDMTLVLCTAAFLSMLFGNLCALTQTSVKRMLAYSGIGNAGYLLIAPTIGEGMQVSMMFFLAVYMFANVGAFLAVAEVEGALGRDVTRADLRGLYRVRPGLAAGLALCLVSLTGLPPAGGFLGKFYLLGRALALNSGEISAALTSVAIFCSVLGAAYYLGTAISLFDGREESPVQTVLLPATVAPGLEPPTSMTSVALVLCCAGVLLLGIVPGPFMAWLSAGLS
jgi:NADH-quinone oxidoreductase subunit N